MGCCGLRLSSDFDSVQARRLPCFLTDGASRLVFLALVMFCRHLAQNSVLFLPSLDGNITGLDLRQILSLSYFMFNVKDQGELVLRASNPTEC